MGGFASSVNAFAVSPGASVRTIDEYVVWLHGNGGGKGTVGVPAPAAAVVGFSQGLARAMARPELHERLGQLGLAVDEMNPAQLATREASCTRNWAEIIKRSGLQPQ